MAARDEAGAGSARRRRERRVRWWWCLKQLSIKAALATALHHSADQPPPLFEVRPQELPAPRLGVQALHKDEEADRWDQVTMHALRAAAGDRPGHS